MSGKDEYRERILKCPFCMTPLSGEVEIDTPFGDTIEGGFCGCGTAFVFDRTGRMLGEAYIDALALAYNWDYDAAFSAAEGEYEEAVVRFNTRVRKYMMEGGGRFDRSPKYYFIRRPKKPEEVKE
jgi:hypothetical protein